MVTTTSRLNGRVMTSLLAAVLLAAAALAAFAAPGVVRAQPGPYGGAGLPAGVLEMSVGGLTLNLNEFPTINTNQPIISGRVNKTSGVVTILVESEPQTFTAAVGSDGRFSAQVPEPLDPGPHKVYVDGNLVGQFTVAGSQAPSPTATRTTTVPGAPNTGAGVQPGDDDTTWLWVLLAVGAGLGVGSAAVWARRRA